MNRLLYAAALVVWGAGLMQGQSAPAFDAASLKVSESRGKASVDSNPGGVTIDGTLSFILTWAYDVKRYQVSGPDWITQTRYRIAARTAEHAAVKDIRGMLQALLAERFKLAVHRENRDLAVYALVVAKGGPKLKESQGDGESATTNAKRLGTGGSSVRTSMARLADLLDGGIGPEPIVDGTGLKGRYDFTLDLSRYITGNERVDWFAVLSEGLRQQLGLNLERRKVSMEVLVVDRAEKMPVEN